MTELVIIEHKDVEAAAYLWWLSKRPIPMIEKGHMSNPTINCETDEEKWLAICVAAGVSV